MHNEFTLDYRFAVESPEDAHYTQTLSDMMGNSPNPSRFECLQHSAPYSFRFHMRTCGNIGLQEYQLDSAAGSDNRFSNERTRSHIALNHSFEFNVAIWLGGEVHLNSGRRSHTGHAGDFFITNTENPFCSRMRNQTHGCNISLPASWDRIGDTRLENIFGINFLGSDRRRNGLVAYARHLLAHPNALALPGAAEKLYDVIALALNPRAKSEHGAGFLALIRNHIDTHYANPHLSPANVALTFEISLRHLHRLFAACDTTFTDYLIEQRLQQAQRMLSDSRFRQQTILSIAFDCGFRDINHFGRRFRMRYGFTPGEFRRMQIMA
ncbi:MAG: AraC family transcriptional regulator [Sideroxyarcus sp.]